MRKKTLLLKRKRRGQKRGGMSNPQTKETRKTTRAKHKQGQDP